ncbi:MAG: DMT family transporter, partial [Verrucomicrobiota bacterium]
VLLYLSLLGICLEPSSSFLMKTSTKTQLTTHTAANLDSMALVVMGGSVLCFTVNSLLLKYLGSVRAIDPSVALAFRAVVGMLVVWCFSRGRRPVEWRRVFIDKGLIARGLTGIVGTAAFYLTIPALGAGKATLLNNTYVLFAAVFAVWFLKESLNRSRVVWIGISFFGVALLVGVKDAVANNSWYDMIGIVGAIAAAGSVILIRRLTSRYSNGTIFMSQCVWVGIAALPFAILRWGNVGWTEFAILSGAALMAGIGQLMLNEGFRRLSVATGAAIQMGWPVLTAFGGIVFFGEVFTSIQVVGSVMILLGIWQVIARKEQA